MKRACLVLALSTIIFSCKNETERKGNKGPKEVMVTKSFEKVAQLQWLVGKWTNITEEEQSYENWKKENDSTLKAHSFTLVEKDTVFAERLTLQQNNGETFLTAIAYNQNNDRPVTFKMISSDNGVFTFENPKHDFPTRISYSNPVKDSIHAWIEGTVEGKHVKVDFYFIKDE